jgi:hypothetical protein
MPGKGGRSGGLNVPRDVCPYWKSNPDILVMKPAKKWLDRMHPWSDGA